MMPSAAFGSSLPTFCSWCCSTECGLNSSIDARKTGDRSDDIAKAFASTGDGDDAAWADEWRIRDLLRPDEFRQPVLAQTSHRGELLKLGVEVRQAAIGR